MSVARFLAGCRPLPNPPGGPWRIERRAAEGGAWAFVTEVAPAHFWDELLAPLAPLDHGDLLRVLPEGVAPADLWVMGREGPRPAPALPFENSWPETATWLLLWEGPETTASRMLTAAALCKVDRRRLVRAACACAAPALARVRAGESAPRAAMEAAWRWAAGPDGGPPEGRVRAGLLDHAKASRDAAADGGMWSAHWHAARAASWAAWSSTSPDLAESAARAAASALCPPDAPPEAVEAGLGERTALVRRHLPLSVVLLAALGEVVPAEPTDPALP